MFGGKYDPRSYYPELKTLENRQAACETGGGEQTTMANMAAATFAVYLFDLWKEVNFRVNNAGMRAYHFRIDKSDAVCKRLPQQRRKI
jgi:hypothetical protein